MSDDVEAYVSDGGDVLVLQAVGDAAAWIESDLAVTPPDAGRGEEDRWRTVERELEEDQRR